MMNKIVGVSLVAVVLLAATAGCEPNQKSWYREATEEELVKCRDAIRELAVPSEHAAPMELEQLIQEAREEEQTNRRLPIPHTFVDLHKLDLRLSAEQAKRLVEASRAFEQLAGQLIKSRKECDAGTLMSLERDVLNKNHIKKYLRGQPAVYYFLGFRRLASRVVAHFEHLSNTDQEQKQTPQSGWYREPTEEELVQCCDAIERLAVASENAAPVELEQLIQQARQEDQTNRLLAIPHIFVDLHQLKLSADQDERLEEASRAFEKLAGQLINGLDSCRPYTLMLIERDVLNKNQTKEYLRGRPALFYFLGYRRLASRVIAHHDHKSPSGH